MSDQKSNQSLFDRLGGEAGAADLVSSFYDRVLGNPELAGFFEGADLDKLHRMQVEFFSAALGGGTVYSGRPLREIHAGRGIQKRHLKMFVGHLLETLQAFDLDENDVRAIYDHIAVHADEITGGGTESG